ncbi:MAG: hypothetical protein Q9196_006507 [Gyalolechia fulgens]
MAPRREAHAAKTANAKSKRCIKLTAKAQAQAPPQRRRAAVSPELPPTTSAQAGDARGLAGTSPLTSNGLSLVSASASVSMFPRGPPFHLPSCQSTTWSAS